MPEHDSIIELGYPLRNAHFWLVKRTYSCVMRDMSMQNYRPKYQPVASIIVIVLYVDCWDR